MKQSDVLGGTDLLHPKPYSCLLSLAPGEGLAPKVFVQEQACLWRQLPGRVEGLTCVQLKLAQIMVYHIEGIVNGYMQ